MTSGTGVILRRLVDTPIEVKLIIHNQLPGVELVSPVYAGEGITCYLSPDQIIDVGFTTKAGFDIDLNQSESIGVLMYKLQRKNADEFNVDVISSEGEAKCIQLVIILEAYISKEFHVASPLIEHDKSHVWDEDKLLQLIKHRNSFRMQHDSIEETYLMRDYTVLMTRMNIIREEECYELEMTISEGSINEDTQRLWYFDKDM
jgi:hypothetical protein